MTKHPEYFELTDSNSNDSNTNDSNITTEQSTFSKDAFFSYMSPTALRTKSHRTILNSKGNSEEQQNDVQKVLFAPMPQLDVAEEVELNTIVTFCGFIVAFAALSYSGTTDTKKRNVIVSAALVVISYTFAIIFIHLNQRNRKPFIFYFLSFVTIIAIAACSFEIDHKGDKTTSEGDEATSEEGTNENDAP